MHAHDGGAFRQDLQAAVEICCTRLAGIVIFLACMGARELLQRSLGELPRMIDEGLIILAWIAMWRPLEALAYEWVPLMRKRRLYERLAGIRVAVRPSPAPAPRP